MKTSVLKGFRAFALLSATAALLVTGILVAAEEYEALPEYNGSTFKEVWDAVKESTNGARYFPNQKVTLSSFANATGNHLRSAAEFTLNHPHDLRSPYQKLIRPNGICLGGTWDIDTESKYTGYFAKGSHALILARASVTFEDTRVGALRSFGMAGKLFPTGDESTQVKTGNFFVIDNNTGTKAEHFLDAPMSTRPSFSLKMSPPRRLLDVVTRPLGLMNESHLAILMNVKATQASLDSHSDTRQLYPISEMGLDDTSKAVTPGFMRIAPATPKRVNEADFRDELRVKNYDSLAFDVLVADSEDGPETRIGKIVFTRDAVSNGCDHRLHFSHPRWK